MKKYLIPVLFLCFSPAFSQYWGENSRLLPHPYLNSAEDFFGYSVAVSGDYAVVGAYGYDNLCGNAYVYYYKEAQWHRVAVLSPSDGTGGKEFGYSVAIDGTTVVVGAPYDIRQTDGSGAVYVYEMPEEGWHDMKETARLTAATSTSAVHLGLSVAVRGDVVAAGAPYEKMGTPNYTGAVYLYVRPDGGWEDMTQTAVLTINHPQNSFLGYSLAIDGGMVVVGAPLEYDRGAVYVFVRPGEQWSDMHETARLRLYSGQVSDHLGSAVSVAEGTIVAGCPGYTAGGSEAAGALFVFEQPAGGWADTYPTARLMASAGESYDRLGVSVAVTGEIVAAGAPGAGADNEGLVFFFRKPAGGWEDMTEDTLLVPAQRTSLEAFGTAVALTEKLLLAGAPGNDEQGTTGGKVYSFMSEAGWKKWSERDPLLPDLHMTAQGEGLGECVAVSGDFAVAGAPGYDNRRGRAYLYHYEDKRWQCIAVLTASDGAAGDNFGFSVDIEGETVVVGATYKDGKGVEEGRVYVFVSPPGGWHDMTETALLLPSTPKDHLNLGYSVAISGEVIVAGAPGAGSSHEGAVFLYRRPAGGWTKMAETARLSASDGGLNFMLGQAVAISKNVVTAGAYRQGRRGGIYLFEKPAGGWADMTETALLTASDAEDGDMLGVSLTLSEEVLAAGATGDDDLGTSSGSVYLFSKPAGGWHNMNETWKYVLPEGKAYDAFGKSVSLSGDTLAVGASSVENIGKNAGYVQILVKEEEGWDSTVTDTALWLPDGRSQDDFGKSVAVAQGHLVVGVPKRDEVGGNSGAVSFFERYPAVVIERQPDDAEGLCTGGEVILTVETSGAQRWRWQMSRDGGSLFSDVPEEDPFRGVTTSVLSFTMTDTLDGYLFRCLVSNPGCRDTSVAARVTLDRDPPLLLLEEDVKVYLNADGMVGLSPEQVIQSVADACSVKDTLLSRQMFTCDDAAHSRKVRVTVTDGNGNTVTDSLWVTVLDTIAPQVTVHNDTVWLDENGEGGFLPEEVITSLQDNCSILDTTVQEGYTCEYAGTTQEIPLTVMDISGNRTTATLLVTVLDTVAPLLTVQDGEVLLDAGGEGTITAAALVTEAWDYCGLADTTVDPEHFTLADTGEVTVTVVLQDVWGNVTRRTARVTVSTVSALGEVSSAALRVYPNPAGDRLYLRVGDIHIDGVCVFDVLGHLLWESGTGALKEGIPVEGLARGVYFVKIKSGRGEYVLRFLKK